MSAVLATNILTNEAVEMRKRLIQSIVQQDLKKNTHTQNLDDIIQCVANGSENSLRDS
jgi:hypothetical protein